VGGALAFVLAAGLAAYVTEYGFKWPAGGGESTAAAPAVEPDVTPASEPGAGAPAATSGTADASATAPLPIVASAQPVADPAVVTGNPLPPVPPGHVSISLAFATDSWAEVYDGSGKAVLYDLGRAGTQRSIAAAAPLSVTIGNAPGVTLAVNGRPASVPTVPGGGTVARFRIEADGAVR
jgi:cytoskeleton protein RodZ